MPPQDYYSLLEVTPQAKPEVIHAAYRVLMNKYHPDKNSGKDEIAKLLNEAYAVLSDQSKRVDYDKSRNNLIGEVVGEYRILELIAEGGFGKTYKGEHILSGLPVCIKDCSNVPSQFYPLLIQEAQAMWDLRHFAIPAVRSLLKRTDGSLALVMSYIPGPTLEQVVEKHGRLDPEHVAWVTERILNALMYLHYQGVIHGDLKPQNIIIQPKTHQIVLVDFGLSLVKPTVNSLSKGYTPVFAPPEEVNGETLVPESDFYSLGMTMIYALSGGERYVKSKEIPENVPDPLCMFIRRLIVRNVLSRPRWDNENLFETIQSVRLQSFGRNRTGMKPLPSI